MSILAVCMQFVPYPILVSLLSTNNVPSDPFGVFLFTNFSIHNLKINKAADALQACRTIKAVAYGMQQERKCGYPFVYPYTPNNALI